MKCSTDEFSAYLNFLLDFCTQQSLLGDFSGFFSLEHCGKWKGETKVIREPEKGLMPTRKVC